MSEDTLRVIIIISAVVVAFMAVFGPDIWGRIKK